MPAEIKTVHVAVHIEPTLHTLLLDVVGSSSVSAYLRDLLLQDLQKKKMIPASILLVMLGSVEVDLDSD